MWTCSHFRCGLSYVDFVTCAVHFRLWASATELPPSVVGFLHLPWCGLVCPLLLCGLPSSPFESRSSHLPQPIDGHKPPRLCPSAAGGEIEGRMGREGSWLRAVTAPVLRANQISVERKRRKPEGREGGGGDCGQKRGGAGGGAAREDATGEGEGEKGETSMEEGRRVQRVRRVRRKGRRVWRDRYGWREGE